MTDRVVLELTGADRVKFLDGLITNDVAKAKDGIIYAALLTPQGKYLFDFFVIGRPDGLWIDVAAPQAPALAQRLNMYRLRADVQIAQTDIVVSRGVGPMPKGAFADPRHPEMGWRHYGETDINEDIDWIARRIALGVPAAGQELTPDSYILEMGFERLNGVDFRKGCFVGQEIVARMKHKTVLKKGLAQVTVTGDVAPGTAVTADNRPVGTLHTHKDGLGLAYLRFDRAMGEMQAGTATVRRIEEERSDWS